MLEQWVMLWAFKHVVLGSILGIKNLKVFSLRLIVTVVKVKHSYVLQDYQLIILSTKPFN